MLSVTQIRDRASLVRLRGLLTSEIEIAMDGALATHIALRCYQAGHHLYKWHKDMICRYIDTCLRRGMPAWSAIREFYEIHGIGEDDFPVENAWKMWQRHNKSEAKKNPVFSGRIRGATAVVFSKKVGRPLKVEIPMSNDEIEAMAKRLVDVASGCLRNPPKTLLKHARCYFYLHHAKRNHQEVAEHLGMPVSSIYYGAAVIRNWRDTDPLFDRLLSQVSDLPKN